MAGVLIVVKLLKTFSFCYLINNFLVQGGISIRDEDDIYIAPSGVQKERIKPDQLFCTDMAGSKFETPCDDKLKLSECTPLFMNAYNLRDAGAVMHRSGVL